MRCDFCGYEPTALSTEEATAKLRRHMDVRHPQTLCSSSEVWALISLHLTYKIPVEDLINLYFETRRQIGQRYVLEDTEFRNDEDKA